MEFTELLDALVNAKPDTEIMVRTRSATYRVTSAEVELDLGPHLTPEDIDTADLADVVRNESSEIAKALLAPRLEQQQAIRDCDGKCTEHRAMLSDKRTVWLNVEKA